MTLLIFNKLEVTHLCAATAFLVSIVLSSCFVAAQNVGGGDKEKDAEIRRLNEELRATQRKLEQAIRAGFLPVEDGFASAQEIIRELPKDLEINASKKWDAFQFEKVNAFIQGNVVGKPFGVNLRVAKVKVGPTTGAAKDPALPKYTVEVLFSVEQFPTQGIVLNQQIYHLHPLTFRGDDEIADAAKKIKIGKAYMLRGVISEVDISAVIGKPNQKDLRIHLAKVQFEPFE